MKDKEVVFQNDTFEAQFEMDSDIYVNGIWSHPMKMNEFLSELSVKRIKKIVRGESDS